MEERDTRFTMDVLTVACERYDQAKARCEAKLDGRDDLSPAERGEVILEELGWAPLAIREYAEGMIEQLTDLFEIQPDDMTEAALTVAILDGCLLGAICADVTYERSFGIAA